MYTFPYLSSIVISRIHSGIIIIIGMCLAWPVYLREVLIDDTVDDTVSVDDITNDDAGVDTKRNNMFTTYNH